MYFAIIGMKKVDRNDLIDLLQKMGLHNPDSIVGEIEMKGRAVIDDLRIMHVR